MRRYLKMGKRGVVETKEKEKELGKNEREANQDGGGRGNL